MNLERVATGVPRSERPWLFNPVANFLEVQIMADNDAKPAEHTTEDGGTFYNASLTGSGTIKPDGTYGEPQPDPTVQRGGVKDGRTSPGGVQRPEPNELIPPAQRAEVEGTERKAVSSKPRNTRG